MSELFNVDWHAMFVPAIGLAEVVLRGSIMYLALFAILRFNRAATSGALWPGRPARHRSPMRRAGRIGQGL